MEILEHKGPVFAPPYEPLPENVKFYYDGELFQGCPVLGQAKSMFYLGIESGEASCSVLSFLFISLCSHVIVWFRERAIRH